MIGSVALNQFVFPVLARPSAFGARQANNVAWVFAQVQ
jgi:hypothetical protein